MSEKIQQYGRASRTSLNKKEIYEKCKAVYGDSKDGSFETCLDANGYYQKGENDEQSKIETGKELQASGGAMHRKRIKRD